MIYVYGKFASGSTCPTITNVLIDSAFKTKNVIVNRFFMVTYITF